MFSEIILLIPGLRFSYGKFCHWKNKYAWTKNWVVLFLESQT